MKLWNLTVWDSPDVFTGRVQLSPVPCLGRRFVTSTPYGNATIYLISPFNLELFDMVIDWSGTTPANIHTFHLCWCNDDVIIALKPCPGVVLTQWLWLRHVLYVICAENPPGRYQLPKKWSQINSLCPSDVIWRQGSRSTLTQVMACCLTAPSHYLNQCWLMMSDVLWHSPDNKFTENTYIYHWTEFEIY